MSIVRSFFASVFCLVLANVSIAAELPDFTELVKDSTPAVVNISTTKKIDTPFAGAIQIDPEELERQLGPWADLFRHFYDNPRLNPQQPEPRERHHSLGSGFIISRDGYVITNNHVVEGADEVIVKLSDRRELVAEIVGTDKSSDIALLKVEAGDLPTVKLGKSSDVKVGEWVLAIGSPFGFDATVTAGIVSAKGRSLPNENYVPFLQTDVAINPGNSGGPLFNLDGEVIGVNSQIYSRTGGFMGLSFAIPMDVAMDVVEQLKANGSVSRGWLGVGIQEVTRDLAESFGLDAPKGALVSSVMEGSPAEDAGVQPGDIILEFNGRKVAKSSALPPMVGKIKAGTKVELGVLRNGKSKTLTVKLGELETEEQAKAKPRTEPTLGRLGLTVTEASKEARRSLKVSSGGVLVKNLVMGAAADAGVRRGDIITHVNNKAVKDVAAFEAQINSLKPGQVVPFLVARSYGREFLAVRIPKDQ